MSHDAPPWAAALFQKIDHLVREVEDLRAALALHVVNRQEAADILGCTTKTVYRYEKKDRLPLANVEKPGAHYLRSDVLNLKRALP